MRNNYEGKIRRELIDKLTDYYGTALYSGLDMAGADLISLDNASLEELIILARKAGIEISDIEIDDDFDR